MSNEFGGRGRGTKRKVEQNSSTSSKKPRGELQTPALPGDAFPKEYPFNKDGYRYIMAEADIHAPFRQEFDESTEMRENLFLDFCVGFWFLKKLS